MSFVGAIPNPLAINLQRQLRQLSTYIPPNTTHYAALARSTTTPQILSALSATLAAPAYTKLVANLFRPILLDLCSRWLENDAEVEEHLFALCSLLEVHTELFPILNRLLTENFKQSPLSFVSGTVAPNSIDTTRVQRLLLSYYRILRCNLELPRQLSWSLTHLSSLIWSPYLDNGVRLMAIRVYAMQVGMGEEERQKLEREVLGELCGVDCELYYTTSTDGTEKKVDGWILPAVETKRVREERNEIATTDMDYYGLDEGDAPSLIDESDLSPHIVNVHGIFLLRSSLTPSADASFIPLVSSTEALRHLALNISSRLPTLLTSAPSAGKALLLSHLANLLHSDTHNQIITIHLADTSLDPRALLGSYVSSTTNPGTFEWKEGVLVRAMREGKWVVFEDIDRGSNEVLGVIKPLVESLGANKWIGGRAQISVPSRGVVVAHTDFMLFATRSILPAKNGFHSPTFFGSHRFYEVQLRSPSLPELRQIVDAKFPRLAGSPANAAIDLWNAVLQLGSQGSGRDVGIRELLKFCQRIEDLLPSSYQAMDVDEEHHQVARFADIFPNPSHREDMYFEARDVFFGAGASTATSRAMAKAIAEVIGEKLGLDTERQQWVLKDKVPEFNVEKDANGRTVAVRVGRTRLPARVASGAALDAAVARPFAMHKPAVLLLSRIANAIAHREPVLLTGETGTGKTSVVSHLAHLLHRPLISLNLSHQTESSDLIGGLKPIDARVPGSALQEKFVALFSATFSRRKNEKFDIEVRKAVSECKWKRAVGLWKESVRLAMDRIQAREKKQENVADTQELDTTAPRKRRKTTHAEPKSSELGWSTFLREVEEFEVQHVHGKGKFAFGFVEGPLVKALRSGDWVLLDEVNLASPETLECISGLLSGPTASITLTEHGSLEPVPRHPDFRLFACMNPATDVGKKDLPPPIRSRFTEIDVPPPDADKETLLSIITQYIGHIAVGDKRIIMDIAEFYTAVKQIAESRQIADGANHRPHFSMRTLVRALTYAADTAASYSLRRSVWEGCLMAFTMVLDAASAELVTGLARKHLLASVRNPKSLLAKDPAMPSQGSFVKFGPFYLEQGPLPPDPCDGYIMTPSVEQKLIDLARIILTRRFPVLIEGPTSSGKTSSVEYLAKRTGHHFVRINNHEHTDIQEYIGSYVSDPVTGKLVFKDGLLVQALRKGHWIVLDELNLAPTDVLEALNRLLDDNRELVIPETHEVVRPHPHFMLFATQNPPGLYAGRKILSRAFRNRFLEVHFEDVPQTELETILCQRCQIAPSYGKKIVAVFHELQKRRQTSRVFESKQGFATLRDLFRWAGRDAIDYQELANNGYMLLAERARREEDKLVVKEVIEAQIGKKIDEDALYDLFRPGVDQHELLGHSLPTGSSIIWTKAMQRLYTLVSRGLKYNEPILLIGETGSGKTSVCQVFTEASGQQLLALNCHQNTETADLIGGLRPVRNRGAMQAELFQEASLLLAELGVETPATLEGLASVLSSVQKSTALSPEQSAQLEKVHSQLSRLNSIFEWQDGPLIEAMHRGDLFLLDEISLADDSVLERLNSVLEPARSIVLAERGGTDSSNPVIYASEGFKLIATMNPGGDYGKKELSPALRNRFTEIWVPHVDDRHDLELIVSSMWCDAALRPYTILVLDFVEWLCAKVEDRSLLGLRDILAWVMFTNSTYKASGRERIPADELFHHAAHMTYLDGLSSLPQMAGFSQDALATLKHEAVRKLEELVPLATPLGSNAPVHDHVTCVQLGSFAVDRGTSAPAPDTFNFVAPTTLSNAMRVVRACQVTKPILLEGSPGVGKTSLITALANLSGHKLCRINLSDQTDIIDLFGSDLPVEGGSAGQFAWKDAEFLTALQEGHWVLLDEMNLAPQAVLEGLNAILDHRGEVYIPEISRTFKRHPSFRIFAAQNPLHQGGGRKGLPKSFVNRFTKVYVDELTPDDLHVVCAHIFPNMDEETLRKMISFNLALNTSVNARHAFAQDGSPWEFNLRDVIRWGTLCSTPHSSRQPETYLRSVYLHRFRTVQDRKKAAEIFEMSFGSKLRSIDEPPPWSITPDTIQFGHFISSRANAVSTTRAPRVMKSQLSAVEAVGDCIRQTWLAILTGSKSSGKTEIVRTLAHFTGNTLKEVSVNSSTDTMDILGSFEQVDTRRRLITILADATAFVESDLRSVTGSRATHDFNQQISHVQNVLDSTPSHKFSEIVLAIQNLLSAAATAYPSSASHYLDLSTRLENLSTSTVGQFEWVDGPLVEAMKSGKWLLLDGANLCGPSVLDRLNSLCEIGGSLTLSERGFVNGEIQRIEPHPNFRLFMSVDPQHGELSRAMRNRGIEISLLPTPVADDAAILRDSMWLPSVPLPSTQINDLDVACFDAMRRGLLPSAPAASIGTASTGRSLDQDSALSTLLDHALQLLGQSSTVDDVSAIQFLSRNLSPGYMPFICRGMSYDGDKHPQLVREFIGHFPSASLAQAVISYKDMEAEQRSVSRTYIDYQPLYFYWMEGNSLVEDFMSDVSSQPRLVLLEAIQLATLLFICHRHDAIDFEIVLSKEKQITLRAVIAEILREMNEVASHSLQQTSAFGAALPSLRLASAVLGISGDLIRAVNSSAFDFSALHAISASLSNALQDIPPIFEPLRKLAQKLHSLISLSRGRGLFKLWAQLYLEHSDHVANGNSIENLCKSLPESSTSVAISRQAFSLMSLQLLPSFLKQDKDIDVSHLQQQLESYLSSNAQEDGGGGNGLIQPYLAVLELFCLSSGTLTHTSQAADVLRQIVDFSCRPGSASLARLVPYQHLVWALEVDKGQASLAARAQISYLEMIWNCEDVASKISGPSLLFHPILIHGAIVSCDMEAVQLFRLARHEAILRDQARLQILQSQQTVDRFTQLSTLLCQTINILASSFANTFDAETFTKMQDIAVNAEGPPLSRVEELVALLSSSHDDALRSAVQEDVAPLLHRTTHYEPSNRLAVIWIGISRVLFKLVIPDTPIDPAVVQHSTSTRIRRQESSLGAQLALQRQLEGLLTGKEDNDITRYLVSQLADLHKSASTMPDVPTRNDVGRLHLYWSEVEQFQRNLLSSQRLESLIGALLLQDSDAHPREQVAQESLQGFYQRLASVYPDFADITLLLNFAILHMRFGLRMLAESSSMARRNTVLTQFISAISAYPAVHSVSNVTNSFNTTVPAGITAFRHVLLTLGAVSLERAIGVFSSEQVLLVDTLYDQAVGLWLIDRAKEKKKTEESSTLYRKVDYNSIDDVEIEEQEFLTLFPTFEDALEGETNAPVAADDRIALLVQQEDMSTMLRLHYELFQPASDTPFSSHAYSHLRSTSIKQTIVASLDVLPENLDQSGVPFALQLLDDSITRLESNPIVSKASYNFYSDPNYAELRRAASLLHSFKERLQTISEEWPDQMVLKHLIDRCATILDARSSSPVAKILAMLEQLLVQTEDWQMYANRDNSIKANQDDIVRLIVDWRRLELSCWQSLLDSQAETFVEGLSDWWFRLYDALVRAPLNTSLLEENGEEVEKYLDTLIPLLDDFVTSSPHGQFAARMQLLLSFEAYIATIAPLKAALQRSALEKVRKILNATYSYYNLFSEALSRSLTEQKKLLERDIKAFIKLASWKDVNVQALKQSAERTHRQLYKVMKKFRDILKQPISSRLQPQMADESSEGQTLPFTDAMKTNATNAISMLPKRPLLERPSMPAYMVNLQATFNKFTTLVNDRVRPFVASHGARILDDRSVEIITTSKRLAAITVPPTESAELKEKHVKALLVRKRKAWADLLKELKHAGLASNVKPEVFRQNTSQKWIREQPLLLGDSLPSLDIPRSEKYYVKLCGSLPPLRTSLPSHHPDLTTRELQRSHMFLESGFSLAVDLRARLATSLQIHSGLRRTVARLEKLSSYEGILHQGKNMLSHVLSIKDLLSKVSYSLVELNDNARAFNRVAVENAVSNTFFNDVTEIIDETKARLADVQDVQSCLDGLTCQYLTQAERERLLSAEEHLTTLHSTLSSWRSTYAPLDHLLTPLYEWFESQKVTPMAPLPPSQVTMDTTSERVLNSLLISVQTLVSRCPETVPGGDDEDEDEKYILKGYQSARDLTNTLNLSSVASNLDQFLLEMSSHPDFRDTSAKLSPFLSVYLSLVEDQLAMHATWMKTLFKFDFVLCSLIQTLSQQGFCQPDEGEAGGEGETKEATGGTGIGEGSGAENVSKEIEDESQVEGLKGEDEASNEKEKQHDDGDAIEMNNDFGGELEDIPESDDEDQAAQSDGESEPDVDETLGDLDQLDPDTVDEKMWGDEKGPEDSKDSDEKADQDHSKEQDGPSEMTAKESKEDGKKKDKSDQGEKEGEKGEEGDEIPEDAEPEEDGQEGQDDSNPDVNGNKMEEHVPEANTLDLPDDLDLQDEGLDKDKDDGLDDDMDMEDDQAMEEDKISDGGMNDDDMDDSAPPEAADDYKADNPDSSMEPQEVPDVLPMDEDAPEDAEKEDDDAVPEDSIARPDLSNQGGTMDPDEVAQPETGDGTSAGEGGASKGQGAEPDASEEDKPAEESNEEADSSAPAQPLENSGKGAATTGAQQGQSATRNEDQTLPNPLRSLGDALKEIQQRFDEILNQNPESAPQKQVGESETQGQIEYLQPDDEDDMQALGHAGEEQIAKLNQLTLIDQDMTAEDSNLPQEIDAAPDAEMHEQPTDKAHRPNPHDEVAQELREDIQGAILQNDASAGQSEDRNALPADDEVMEELTENAELQMTEWRAADYPESGAEHLWRVYVSLTHDIAYTLCEQLRLILEPTMATRLKGDYRTGKRLNMKKVISYIASDYTKDKIWLRRTKPSQREYQILLSIDDSRSMAESHSIHLAYQTLALISKALGRLESGDIAIAKFGETFDLLHGFDVPLTDQAGSKVLNAFRFSQKATNVLSLLETSLKVLEKARERKAMSSASAADLWQLQIIISDGICQDHEKLRTILRKAEEQRVMIVFIVLDSLQTAAAEPGTKAADPSHGSILNLAQAVYKVVDGRIELETKKYLDTFPFEYYVILRQVEALPEVLAGTLKQFFERISEE